MYPDPYTSHQLLAERLDALRQEAAQARLVSGLGESRPGFLASVLSLFRSRRDRAVAPPPGVGRA